MVHPLVHHSIIALLKTNKTHGRAERIKHLYTTPYLIMNLMIADATPPYDWIGRDVAMLALNANVSPHLTLTDHILIAPPNGAEPVGGWVVDIDLPTGDMVISTDDATQIPQGGRVFLV